MFDGPFQATVGTECPKIRNSTCNGSWGKCCNGTNNFWLETILISTQL